MSQLLVLIFLVTLYARAWCFNDQVLGRWKISYEALSSPKQPDQFLCGPSVVEEYSSVISLVAPNVAIDERSGATGLWVLSGTGALQITIGGMVFYFHLFWEILSDGYIHSVCDRYMPGYGWATKEGVTPRHSACLMAENIESSIFRVENYNRPGEFPDPSHNALEPTSVAAPFVYGGDLLPKTLNWLAKLQLSPLAQGECNTSYIVAALWTMMMRVIIASDSEDSLGMTKVLSMQHVLNCNYYSDGCSGGTVEEVVRFSQDYGILTDDFYTAPTQTSGNARARARAHEDETSCRAPDTEEGRYFFTLGAPYGGTQGAVASALELQWELFRHGPFPAYIDADNVEYRNCSPYGPDAYRPPLTKADRPERHYLLQKVNHAVSIIGWGTWENGTQYWLIQDSKGFLPCGSAGDYRKIAMGSNEYGIESSPVMFYWFKIGAVPMGRDVITLRRGVYNVLVALTVLFALTIVGLVATLVILRRRKRIQEEKLQREDNESSLGILDDEA